MGTRGPYFGGSPFLLDTGYRYRVHVDRYTIRLRGTNTLHFASWTQVLVNVLVRDLWRCESQRYESESVLVDRKPLWAL